MNLYTYIAALYVCMCVWRIINVFLHHSNIPSIVRSPLLWASSLNSWKHKSSNKNHRHRLSALPAPQYPPDWPGDWPGHPLSGHIHWRSSEADHSPCPGSQEASQSRNVVFQWNVIIYLSVADLVKVLNVQIPISVWVQPPEGHLHPVTGVLNVRAGEEIEIR